MVRWLKKFLFLDVPRVMASLAPMLIFLNETNKFTVKRINMTKIEFPIKLYRLGEPAITTNSMTEYEAYINNGWSISPQVYSHKDFPRVIYHVIEGNKTVKTSEELQEYIKKGWSTTYKEASEVDALKARIVFHNSEFDRLQEEYLEKTGAYLSLGIYAEDDEEIPPVISEKPEESIEGKHDGSPSKTETIKKRGRPSKKG
jgi:hypothetical protein